MNRTLWISATGMECQQLMTDTIANNMANVNTTAYKRSAAQFQDMLYQNMGSPGAATADSVAPVGAQLGTGSRTGGISKNFSQGGLKNTSSALDLALEGDGFFEVTMPDGSTAVTRAGSFHLNAAGQVVTVEGYPVVGFPAIETTATAIDISRDGTVSTTVDGKTSSKGQVQLVRFPSPEGLSSLGHNLYAATEASGTAQRGNPGTSGFGTVAQYFQESSNVEIVSEMVDMIASQRAYEMNSKGIKTADEMLRMVANLR
ncbi:MAG: flagellar basal-body rod protein FlgG [Lentisphaerae bacterium RIFOXYB12_FULL_65_16]|nr:MAG: flagellar basal-body rod protein FlgG [Lentisphaerae bacterium RIFOXYA12_64_32]OGV92055.1 MAG: flagellar basal-body rod protein FlgG [Lentisphaerae bacterium RIFOXYB12_FULL_65_16]